MISRVDDSCVLRFYIRIYRCVSSLSVYSTLRRILAVVSRTLSFTGCILCWFLQTQTRTQKTILSFTSQHSSTGSPTIVYFKLAQLSHKKRPNYTDSQAHSQDWISGCRCLGWQKRGVSEIGEASPSSSATKQNIFYPVLNCLVFFHYDPKQTLRPPNSFSIV